MANEPVAVLSRAVTIMNLITSQDGDIGIREIARRTGIHSATVHRIVATLEGAGLLEQDPQSLLYRVGPLAFTWGASFANRADMRQMALPLMRGLRDRFDETVALSLQTGTHRMYLEQLPSNRAVRTTINVGAPYDLFAGAAGIALLSVIPDSEVESLMESAAIEASRRKGLRALVAEARQRGFAGSHEQIRTGVSAASSGLVDANGARWALSLVGPSARIDAIFEEAGAAVKEAAAALTGLPATANGRRH